MKVSQLKIKNLGPFHVKPVELDFENGTLADASLVAITGQTGAGKTMLFDAICVALYGKTPRLSSPKFLLSHGETEGDAEVLFEANGTRYLAEWRVRGTTARTSRKLLKVDSEELLAEGMAVTEKIKSILGLDFTDFRRSVMLAQGDFAAFLKANPAERLAALVRAADIGIYEELAGALSEKTKLVEAAYAEAKLSELKKKADSLHNGNRLWRLREGVIRAFEALQSAVTAVCETKKALDLVQEELKQRRADFEAIDDAYRRAENAANVAFTYVCKARAVLQAERELLKLEDDLIARDESLDEVERKLAVQTLVCKRADAEVSRLEAERELAVLAVPIKELRQRLKPGDPCLVCGATEHPHADQIVPGEQLDMIEKELATARTKAREAAEQLATLTEEKGRLRESKANIAGQVEVRQSELENLKAETEASRVQWREIYPDTEISEWAPLVEIDTAIRKLEDALQEEATERDIPEADIDVAVKKLEDAVREKATQRDEANQVLQDSKRSLAVSQADYENRRSFLAACVANLETARATYLEKLREVGLDSPGAHANAFREDAWMQEVEKEISDYVHEKHNLEVDIAGLRARFAETPFDPEELGQITAKLAEIAEELQNMQRDIGAQEAEVEELERSLPMDRGYEGTIHNAESEMQRWSSLQRVFLADRLVANRNDFPSFAAEMVFRQLSTIANAQLEYLTSGRYQLKVESISNLAVVDKWNANKERPVETLSGGESFLTSLALALALSELSRGRAEIGALFLDEGFGTLDAETLDVAISALEGLRLQGRSIFLISHIQELTRRLPVKINVRKRGNGSSTVRVQG